MKDSDLPATNCAPVTVIIPAYNVELCLERAVSSALGKQRGQVFILDKQHDKGL